MFAMLHVLIFIRIGGFAMKRIVFLILLLAFPTLCFGTSVRCDGHIIRPGVSKYDVKKYCGKPDEVSIIGSTKGKSDYYENEAVKEEWYYERLSKGKDYVIIVAGTTVSSVHRIR